MRHALVFGGILGLAAFGLGCGDKDKAKAEEAKKSEPTPVPSDLVFNDFLPTTGGNTAGLGVRDAGLEGGLPAVAAGAGGDPGDPGAAGAAPEKLRVVEPGAEPRALQKYSFVANRVDKRLLTMQQSVSQSMGGQTQPGQEITLRMALDLTPKQVKPAGSQWEAKLTKVDLPGAPPQAAQMLAPLAGMSGTFDVTPRGEAGEISIMASAQMRNQLAETVLQGMSQAVQLLLAPFPDAPVGVGAKWEVPPGPEGDQGKKHFTLKELSKEGAVVEADIEIKVPRRATQSPRGGGPMFVEVEGKGHYVYQVKFDRIASKVEGELAIAQKIEVTDPKAGKQQVVQIQKARHLLEMGTAAAAPAGSGAPKEK